MQKIVITGGTGLVGRALAPMLRSLGFEVMILSTNKKNVEKGEYLSYWCPSKGEVDVELVRSVDYIIHLAGYNLMSKRWNDGVKQLILSSRVESAKLLFNVLNSGENRLKAFVSASGVGYYGAVTNNNIYTEEDRSYSDFVSQVCVDWEASADLFQSLCDRVIKLRLGIVLTDKGGAISKMETPVKLGIGSAIGKGDQFMPWIHLEDLVAFFVKSIQDESIDGVYNAVAPEHVTNDQLTKQMADQLSRPYFFPKVPAFVLKLLFGEMGLLMLEGSKVSADKVISTGFEFKYPTIKEAFKQIFDKS